MIPDRDKIIALALTGARPAEIAQEVGCKASRVHSLLSYERARGADIPHSRRGPPVGERWPPRVTVSHAVLEQLEPCARPRGLTARELAAMLLEKIVADDLVEAVLDDGGDDA